LPRIVASFGREGKRKNRQSLKGARQYAILKRGWVWLLKEEAMQVEKKQDVLQLLYANDATIRAYGVRRYGLFGSFVRDQPQADSDVDILVEFEPEHKTFDNFINLAWYLESLLGRSVDLITAESLSPYLGPHILHEVEYVTVNP
jgi:uncharacterized protein